VAPLEPEQKVLVSEEFLESAHGELACIDCHGGDESAPDKESAHQGFDAHPSINNPQETCGECHEEIAETAPRSLHATLSTFATFLQKRTSADTWPDVDKGRERHCVSCHASCGACHVSRPKYVGSGFVNGHVFSAQPDPVNQCATCHGSRVGNEFFGNRGQGDVHLRKFTMSCNDCHGGEEMHAAAPEDLENRYHLKEASSCKDCHQDLQFGSVREHRIHNNKVQCQVCHSQTYTNCYSCHTGTDEDGIAYFVNNLDFEDMKIGFNPDRIPGNNYKFVLLRHVPVDPKVFDPYIKDGFPRFDVAPTWKRTSPHNIQRRTWQNVTCNNCHGQRDLYLSDDDLFDYEKKANFGLTVTDQQIPKKRARTMKVDTDLSGVMSSRVVDPKWLKENLDQEKLVIIDARSEADYEKGHIPGAISLDPNMGEGLRKDPYSESPLYLEEAEILAETFGDYGIAVDDHVVVYCDKGQNGGFLLSILDYAGAENISLLNGGIAAWNKAGYEITDEETGYQEKTFEINLNKGFLADNDFVKANLDNPYTVIVDVRILQQSMGLVQHGLADRSGHIPGSVKLPVFALYEDHSGIKTAEELLWVLKERNIPKDKTIILTGNTGNWAGAAHFVFRYLGYPDVRVHDESWIGWKN
jgi:thiosulfate/3-mercaptopyruvate sulfurtransferase